MVEIIYPKVGQALPSLDEGVWVSPIDNYFIVTWTHRLFDDEKAWTCSSAQIYNLRHPYENVQSLAEHFGKEKIFILPVGMRAPGPFFSTR